MNQPALITPLAMAQWWDRDPRHTINASEFTGSAALWDLDWQDPLEFSHPADPQTHILSMHTRTFRHETFHDGRLVHRDGIQRGGATILPAGVSPRAVLPKGFGCLHVYIKASELAAFAERAFGVSHEIHLRDPANAPVPELWRIGQELIGAMRGSGPLHRLEFDGLYQALCARLLGGWSNLAETVPKPIRRGLAPWQVNRVRELMAADLACDHGLARLAEEVRLSTFHFARAFRQATGETPHRFLVNLRLRRACELLAKTDLPITEISALVGYDDPGNLGRVFRRELGFTPSAYRRDRRS